MRQLLLVAVFVAAAASAASTQAPIAAIRCDYTQKIECGSAGCQAAPIAGGYLRMPPLATLVEATARATTAAALPTIQVCDAKACTPIAVRAVRGGAFINVAQDGGAHFVKVAVTDIPPGTRKGDFVEVAARFLSTATYVGSCPAIVP